MRAFPTALLTSLLLLAPLRPALADEPGKDTDAKPAEAKAAAKDKAEEAKAPAVPSGKPIFLKYKCTGCHEVAMETIKRSAEEAAIPTARKPPDLSGIGTLHKAEWIRNFLARKETIHGRKHWMAFRGSAGETDTLVNWLASLKDEKGAKAIKELEDKK